MIRAADNTLVAAAIALTLCIVASLAHAQTITTDALNRYPGDLSLIIPSCVNSNQCYSAPHCPDGWVMVRVPTSAAYGLTSKCVAVGDLKDPQ